MEKSKDRVIVIADTNFLMIPGLFKVDIMKELDRLLKKRHSLLVPSQVVRELERISERGKPKERVAAKLGLDLVKHGEIIEIGHPADEAILKLALEKDYVVGTTDAALRKTLRFKGVPTIFLRQKSHLAVDGQIE